MNRAFTAVAFQAAVAAAVLTVAPLASAAGATPIYDEAHGPQITGFVSQVSRDQVRAEAALAARQVYTHTDQQHEPNQAAAVSPLTRAQVRAEAVAANRTGLTFSSEYAIAPRASQPGLRLASGSALAAVH